MVEGPRGAEEGNMEAGEHRSSKVGTTGEARACHTCCSSHGYAGRRSGSHLAVPQRVFVHHMPADQQPRHEQHPQHSQHPQHPQQQYVCRTRRSRWFGRLARRRHPRKAPVVVGQRLSAMTMHADAACRCKKANCRGLGKVTTAKGNCRCLGGSPRRHRPD